MTFVRFLFIYKGYSSSVVWAKCDEYKRNVMSHPLAFYELNVMVSKNSSRSVSFIALNFICQFTGYSVIVCIVYVVNISI